MIIITAGIENGNGILQIDRTYERESDMKVMAFNMGVRLAGGTESGKK